MPFCYTTWADAPILPAWAPSLVEVCALGSGCQTSAALWRGAWRADSLTGGRVMEDVLGADGWNACLLTTGVWVDSVEHNTVSWTLDLPAPRLRPSALTPLSNSYVGYGLCLCHLYHKRGLDALLFLGCLRISSVLTIYLRIPPYGFRFLWTWFPYLGCCSRNAS